MNAPFFEAGLAEVVAMVLDDFQHLPDRPIGSTASRAQMEALLREPVPAQGQPLSDVLAEFRDKVVVHALRPQHPRFWAFVPSAPSPVSVLGDILCAAYNFFPNVWLEGAGPAQVEIIVLDWFKELLGYPQQARGILTSGGSEANLVALLVARESLSWEQRQRAVIYVSSERHRSIDRAIGIMGFRPDQIRSVPVDGEFRLDLVQLSRLHNEDLHAGQLPWVVVASAGTTNTGTIDPLDSLADFCKSQQLWLHVDAAYGWPAAFANNTKASLTGLAEADSLTLDPHKWFGQTFDAGCVLIRDGNRLPATFALQADYLQDVQAGADEINFADHGPALSRRFRALKIWFSMKVLGIDWFRNLVKHCCDLADLAESSLRRTGNFEILSSRKLSVVCFRHVPAHASNLSPEALDRINLDLCAALRQTQQAFLSTTRLHGHVALRMCFVNWRTTPEDVQQVVALLETLADTTMN